MVRLPTGKRIYLHRLVMELLQGYPLNENEIVHHLDENKKNNYAWNLEKLSGQDAHLHRHNYHKKEKPIDENEFSEFGW